MPEIVLLMTESFSAFSLELLEDLESLFAFSLELLEIPIPSMESLAELLKISASSLESLAELPESSPQETNKNERRNERMAKFFMGSSYW
jgi:hypothetical protein